VTGREGWGWPEDSRKAHYFRKDRSLCGRWCYWGEEIWPRFSLSEKDCCAICLDKKRREEKQSKC